MPEMFRVVGTRRDKNRATLVVGLTEERARSTMLALVQTGLFISVEIESEPSDGRTILVPRARGRAADAEA